MRQKYAQDQLFFEKYKSDLEAFHSMEWDDAKNYFRDILENFDDGPSKYFLTQIDENKNRIPPKGFRGYGIADWRWLRLHNSDTWSIERWFVF
jgi:hypothetical protein